jgi:hypothetical protein
MDLGIAFGLLGIATAVFSALYARSQALEARRQAEAARLQAIVEVNRAMSEQMLVARMGLVNSPILMAEYLEANPELAAVYRDPAQAQSLVQLRNLLDSFQDMYFLRKEGIAASHQWRQWTAALVPVARMPTFRGICGNAIEREAVEKEFVEFLRLLLEGKPMPDPVHDSAPVGT